MELKPQTLYNACCSAVAMNYSLYRCVAVDIHELPVPEVLLIDVFYQMHSKKELLPELTKELSDLRTMERVLTVKGRRQKLLHSCFQAVMDQPEVVAVSSTLAAAYSQHCSDAKTNEAKEKSVELGIMLGNFLKDAGWYVDAAVVLEFCKQLLDLNQQCPSSNSPSPSCSYLVVEGKTTATSPVCEMCYPRVDPDVFVLNKEMKNAVASLLEIGVCLVRVYTENFDFKRATQTWKQVEAQLQIVEKKGDGEQYNKAHLYSQYGALLFSQNLYKQAYEYCCKALQELRMRGVRRKGKLPALPMHVVVDVFRECSKICDAKNYFKRGENFIKCAVKSAKECARVSRLQYAAVLSDYGLYLSLVGAYEQAVQVYQAVLDIHTDIFGDGAENLLLAISHEDLAYSTYGHEYNTGMFTGALGHIEKAISMMTKFSPTCDINLGFAKRIKALILEEIAIDSDIPSVKKELFHEARELHLFSLDRSKKAFGWKNVLTANSYGNIGRLYQTMGKYQAAEKMHLKAITITEQLLGPDGDEVAKALGLLASLYNYDMKRYDKAEAMYLRALDIETKLFGESYTGLEYHYRGLIHLYRCTNDVDKCFDYQNKLEDWTQHRNRTMQNQAEENPLEFDAASYDIEDVINQFFEMTTSSSSCKDPQQQQQLDDSASSATSSSTSPSSHSASPNAAVRRSENHFPLCHSG